MSEHFTHRRTGRHRGLRFLAAAAATLAAVLTGWPAAASAATSTHTSTHATATATATSNTAAGAQPGQSSPDYYDSGLDPTPYMGWNTYFGLGAPSESAVESVAQYLISSGLAAAGYDYVWLDGGWQATPPRNAAGQLVADPTRFPDGIPALVGYLHGLGLKVGIYTDAGVYNSADCGLGSGGGYYQQDADQFAAWQIDAIKVDFLCGIAEDMNPATAFQQFSAAVAQSGRPMLLNLCNPLTAAWGEPNPSSYDASDNYTFGPTIADSWRTDTDVAFGTPTAGEFPSVLRNIDDNVAHPEANGPGHYNDPDYLIPMRPLSGGGYELDQTQSTTQFVMWAEMASPLIIGSDPRTLPQSMITTLENPEILAVDQDPLDIQGVAIDSSANGTVYSKVLSGDGRRSVVLLNRSDSPQTMTVTFADAGLGGSVSVRDLEARKQLGTFTGSYTTTVPADGTAMLLLTGADALPGTDLGGHATGDPALVQVNDGPGNDADSAAFVRGPNGRLEEQTTNNAGAWSGRWTDLGGPAGGIIGQPAAYAGPNGSIDLFVLGDDSHAYRRSFARGVWGPWVSLGGQKLADAPTVAYTGPNSWLLTATGSDGNVWTRGANTGWTSIGTPAGLSVCGRPSAVTEGSSTYVAVRANDDSVWLDTQGADGAWSGWTGLGGTVSSSPTLLATGSGVRLFERASDYTLWEDDLTGGTWSWSKDSQFTSDLYNGAFGAAADGGDADIAYRGVDGSVHVTQLAQN